MRNFILALLMVSTGCGCAVLDSVLDREHRVYAMGTFLGENTDRLTPSLFHEMEIGSDWYWQTSVSHTPLDPIFQFGLIRRVRLSPLPVEANIGISQIATKRLEPVQCSQANVRLGVKSTDVLGGLSVAFFHDSNGGVCEPNPGLNHIGLGYKLDTTKLRGLLNAPAHN